jgi:hypothetical protein
MRKLQTKDETMIETEQPVENRNKYLDAIFYPDVTRRMRWLEVSWIAGLFLLGVYLWGKFLSWNTLTLDYYDWAVINVPRLAFLQNAIKAGVLPLHMAGMASLKDVTDRFLTLPDVITTPQVLLLRFIDIPSFVLIDILINFSIGVFGMLLLRRRFKLSLFAFSVLFFMFSFNGYILSHFSVGHLTWNAYFLFPLVFYFIFRFLDGDQGWRWLAGFSFTLFYMILAGGQHHFVWILIFLAVLMLFNLRRAHWLLAAGFFSGILSAIRLLPPALELKEFGQIPILNIVLGYPSVLEVFDSMMFVRRNILPPKPVYVQYNMWTYMKLNWEFNFYIGIIGVVFLVIFGLYFWFKEAQPRYWQLIVPAFVLVALSIGGTYWPLRLSGIPIFGSERITSRMIALPVVLFMIMAVINLQVWLSQKRSQPWHQGIIASLFVLFVIDLSTNMSIWRLSETALMVGSTPFDPLGSLVANHPDPIYTTTLLVGLFLTLATALGLTVMALREKKIEKVI